MGSVLGTGVGASLIGLRQFNILKAPKIPISYTSTLLRSGGTGAAITTALMCIALPLRMRGREDIEWQDRSWRLIENKGQVECDDFTYPGMLASGVAYGLRGKGLGWRGAVGSVGLGSVIGMLGYMGWRYGIKGGKYDEFAV